MVWQFTYKPHIEAIGNRQTDGCRHALLTTWDGANGQDNRVLHFYRAMHFSARRGIAIAYRLSVSLSVRLSVSPSVTLVNCDYIGWNSSKIISPLVSLGRSLFATPT